ncbi:unnamed protein product, partial [Ectocarpus sp. 8 AP-2014]
PHTPLDTKPTLSSRWSAEKSHKLLFRLLLFALYRRTARTPLVADVRRKRGNIDKNNSQAHQAVVRRALLVERWWSQEQTSAPLLEWIQFSIAFLHPMHPLSRVPGRAASTNARLPSSLSLAALPPPCSLSFARANTLHSCKQYILCLTSCGH